MALRTLGHVERRLRQDMTPARYRRFLRAWVVGGAQGRVRRARVRRRLGVTPPSCLNASPTMRCNLRCSGCYAANHPRDSELGAEDLERLVVQARELGARFVGLLGGEPFLRPDVLPVLARHPELAFRITTNGTLLDDEAVEFLHLNPHAIAFVSLEGSREATDAWRGAGVYDRIVEAMGRMRAAHVVFGFSALLHRDNLDEVTSTAFLEHMVSLGARFGAFFAYGPVGRSPDFDLVVPEERLRTVLPDLERRCLEQGLLVKIEGYTCAPGSPLRFLHGPGCQAGAGVHVLPTGEVEPCNGIHFSAGNALRQPLVDVLRAPFYARIHSAARAEEGRCVAIYRPEWIRRAAEGGMATPTNDHARSSLDAWLAHRSLGDPAPAPDPTIHPCASSDCHRQGGNP